MEDLVSVIVPVYNTEKYLRKCIDSIVEQTYTNLDIILVDDGSTDASGVICDEYAGKDSRIRVIHKENEGNGQARNTGLNYTEGGYILWVDSDDMIHRKQVEVLLSIAKEKNADIVVGGYCAISDGEEPKDQTIADGIYDNAEVLSDSHLYDDGFIKKRSMILTVPWCKICKRELYDHVRYPHKRIHLDTWTTWKLYENSQKVVFVAEPLYYWRNNPDSLTRRKFDLSHFSGIEAYREQLEYYHTAGRQRYVEIVFDEYVNDIFWCYNRMKESDMDPSPLKPYWQYMKKHVGYIKLTRSIGIKNWLRYRYLAYYKIPKLLFH